jgi:hypothetical protein
MMTPIASQGAPSHRFSTSMGVIMTWAKFGEGVASGRLAQTYDTK